MRSKNEGAYRGGKRDETFDHGLFRRSLRVKPPTWYELRGKVKGIMKTKFASCAYIDIYTGPALAYFSVPLLFKVTINANRVFIYTNQVQMMCFVYRYTK